MLICKKCNQEVSFLFAGDICLECFDMEEGIVNGRLTVGMDERLSMIWEEMKIMNKNLKKIIEMGGKGGRLWGG